MKLNSKYSELGSQHSEKIKQIYQVIVVSVL
jgi:hypothetical protein